jgi:hypothetical protein
MFDSFMEFDKIHTLIIGSGHMLYNNSSYTRADEKLPVGTRALPAFLMGRTYVQILYLLVADAFLRAIFHPQHA